MKVAFILPGPGVSGGVRVTVAAANGLLARGHEVRLFVRRGASNVRGVLRYLRNRVLFHGVNGVRTFQGQIATFQGITDCSFHDEEIILGVGMWASAELSRLKDISNPKIQYIHGATPWEPGLMERALSEPIPKIVVSSHLKPLVESYGGGEVIAIVHNGLDQNEFFDSSNGSERDGVGTIYSSHPAKDPETVLAVIERLRRLRPDIPIRIFSADKRPKAIERGCFWRYPSGEKAREIYSRSLVWIMASRSEGFPAPPLEAMACGCAVVATDCGGTRDMINDGENGFLVDVGSVEQIVNRVLMLLDDEALRGGMCLRARETVREFTWDKSISDLEKALLSLNDGKGLTGDVKRKNYEFAR